MTKMFVGGIPYSTTKEQLEELFAQFGQVVSVNIVTDKFSGQSKGFAFVEMENDSEAQEAIKQLDGSDFNGRKIGVSVARPKEEFSSRGGNNFRRNDSQRPNRNFNRNNFRR